MIPKVCARARTKQNVTSGFSRSIDYIKELRGNNQNTIKHVCVGACVCACVCLHALSLTLHVRVCVCVLVHVRCACR